MLFKKEERLLKLTTSLLPNYPDVQRQSVCAGASPLMRERRVNAAYDAL